MATATVRISTGSVGGLGSVSIGGATMRQHVWMETALMPTKYNCILETCHSRHPRGTARDEKLTR